MLKNKEALQKAIEAASGRLHTSNVSAFRHQQMMERIVEQVMADRPDLANDFEALADEALRRLPELVRHLEER